MSRRRQRDGEKEEPTAEGHLGPQLGSDTVDLVQGKVDMRRFSKINSLDKLWISYMLQVPKERGGNFAKKFAENYLNLAVSEDGWRVNKVIQAIAAGKGAPSVGELMKKPGWASRNITQRDWKRKAKEEGKTVVE